MNQEDIIKGLARLREPFPEHQISKLPKPTRQQTESVKTDRSLGIRCKLCGTWHHKDVIHLDYVGHAALTDRLLECDPFWNWEPLAYDYEGLPKLDRDGGLWLKLTIFGLTRLGYGDAGGKTGGDAMKERIGDGLRNAGMRFGCALGLWHKGELHIEEETPQDKPPQEKAMPAPAKKSIADYRRLILHAANTAQLASIWKGIPPDMKLGLEKDKDDRKKELQGEPMASVEAENE